MANINSFAQNVMTFGIELEFIAVYPTSLFNTEHTPDVATALSRGFVAAGVPSTGHETLDDDIDINSNEKPYSKWCVHEEGGLSLSDKALTILKQQDLEIDVSVDYLEISSRKLSFGEDWQNEIKTALNVFGQLHAMGVHFITNGTTGFHLHVGFGETLMPLRTAKSVFQLVTAFEDRLDSLYSTTRTSIHTAKPNAHFNAGLAWHFQHNESTDFGCNMFHWLVSIEEAKSHEALGKFFHNYVEGSDPSHGPVNSHYSTLNMDNLYPSDVLAQPKNTIEFRQHQGTLDFKEICAFIELKKTLVSYCHNAYDVDFLRLCQHVPNPQFTLVHLIQAIGGSRQLVVYHQNRDSHAVHVSKRLRVAKLARAVGDQTITGIAAVEAQTQVENWESDNVFVREGKIQHKRIIGAYADVQTAMIDIPSEYNRFIECNRPYMQGEELLNRARIMIFQQLNGSDSS